MPSDPEHEGTPRWVKVFLALGAMVALAVIALLLAGPEHGPGRHAL